MKMYLYVTNGYNGVVFVKNNKAFDCNISANGKFNDEIDIYNETDKVVSALQEYIKQVDFNSFDDLVNEFPNNILGWNGFKEQDDIELYYIGEIVE